MITVRNRDDTLGGMSCGSTTILSRYPLTVAICVSYARINERYAPRASLELFDRADRFGCGVPIYRKDVLEAIGYLGNVSRRLMQTRSPAADLPRASSAAPLGSTSYRSITAVGSSIARASARISCCLARSRKCRAAGSDPRESARMVPLGGKDGSVSDRLPVADAIIGGAPRSGTTFLCELLAKHPDVFVAKPFIPEPKVCMTPHPDGDAGLLQRYATFFSDAPRRAIRVEKTSYYLENAAARERLVRILPLARFVFILREPVERAYSNWMRSRDNGLETLPLRGCHRARAQPGVAAPAAPGLCPPV